MSVPRALQQAVKFHQQGQLTDAERLYREVLRAEPRDFEALHLLGVLKLQQDQPQEAALLIRAALEVDATSSSAHSNYGLALAALGRHEEALASYDRALAIRPRDADTLANRADTLCDLGRTDEALANYDQAIAINPRLVPALVNRGIALRNVGRPADALASHECALKIDAGDAEAWNNRGVALQDVGRPSEALASYERALALRPDYADALFNHGNAMLALRRPAEALSSYARVIALRPNLADAHNNRGNAFSALRRYDEALACYDRALAIAPTHIDALANRAGVLAKLERYDEAIVQYERLREIAPGLPFLLNELVGCHVAAGSWPDTEKLSGDLVAAAVAGRVALDPFRLLGFDCTAEQQFACAKHWLRHKKVAAVPRQWDRSAFSTDKIRVAYLSADFHRHVTAYVTAELFELHDRSKFEIIGVSFGPDDGSKIRSRLVKSFDRFFDVSFRSDEDAADLVRNLHTHIAVDLKGHTTDARIGILAQRPAPVQVSYMGFPATTGADFIDYIIADKNVLPFDQQPFFAEKIVHLPDCYYANDSQRQIAARRPTRAEAGLPEDAFVFCCFNNSWKITAQMFDVWMRLLGAVDGSVLWLFRANDLAAANLRREAQVRGIDPARIVFAPPMDLPDHLARVPLANLFLDTLPYNAHTTATDALWMGVPIVTCVGNVFVGRVAMSLLQALGLPELVTTSLSDYETLALRMAEDPAFLRSIREKLAANRLKFPLFDSDRFRRHMEAAYTAMWQSWLRGENPRSFSVDAIEDGRPR